MLLPGGGAFNADTKQCYKVHSLGISIILSLVVSSRRLSWGRLKGLRRLLGRGQDAAGGRAFILFVSQLVQGTPEELTIRWRMMSLRLMTPTRRPG